MGKAIHRSNDRESLAPEVESKDDKFHCVFEFLETTLERENEPGRSRIIDDLPGPSELCLKQDGYCWIVKARKEHKVDDVMYAPVDRGRHVEYETRRIGYVPEKSLTRSLHASWRT